MDQSFTHKKLKKTKQKKTASVDVAEEDQVVDITSMSDTPVSPMTAAAIANVGGRNGGGGGPVNLSTPPLVADDRLTVDFEYVPEEPRIEQNVVGPSFSVIWDIIATLRPGMSLISVSLPSYLLQPASFLEKREPMAHCVFLNEAARDLPDEESRFLCVFKWALSAWYQFPQLPKKPANPILGEIFRSRGHFQDGTDVYEILEQVSHHPPVTAHYASNRKAGWVVQNTVGFDPVFLGLSAEARFLGGGRVRLTRYDEEYFFSPIPTASASGFWWGPLTFVFIGDCWVRCPKTGYSARFNLKAGKGEVTLNGKPVFTVQGRFDEKITFNSVDAPKSTPPRTLFQVDRVHQLPMQRWVVPLEKQKPNESAKVWHDVIQALLQGDTVAANKAKVIVEEAQRARAAERKANNQVWAPKYFDFDPDLKLWNYKWANFSVFNPEAEQGETEIDGIIKIVPSKKKPSQQQQLSSKADETLVVGANKESAAIAVAEQQQHQHEYSHHQKQKHQEF